MATMLLTSRQIAEQFGVTVDTVRTWVRQGRIPFVRVTRRTIRFDPAQVVAALGHPRNNSPETMQ